jgi:ABC-2 type transport system ATP-binding protein
MASMSEQSYTHNKAPQVLSAEGLSKAFINNRKVLSNFGVALCPGEIVAVVGNNGSGKSTCIKVLSGGLIPDSGNVNILGYSHFSAYARSQIGYVSQTYALDGEMTGREIAYFIARLHGVAGNVRERVVPLAEAFGLNEYFDQLVSKYSGGMRQRLNILLGLVHTPKILLLDEPTAGLDPLGRSLFWGVLRTFAMNGGAVLLSSHDLEEVMENCSRVLLLEKGEIRCEDAPSSIVEEYGLWCWRAELESNKLFDAERRRNLESLAPWLALYEINGNVISLWAKEMAPIDIQIIEVLSSLGVNVVSYERRRPDLASAYRNLTGIEITNSGKKRSSEKNPRFRRKGF